MCIRKVPPGPERRSQCKGSERRLGQARGAQKKRKEHSSGQGVHQLEIELWTLFALVVFCRQTHLVLQNCTLDSLTSSSAACVCDLKHPLVVMAVPPLEGLPTPFSTLGSRPSFTVFKERPSRFCLFPLNVRQPESFKLIGLWNLWKLTGAPLKNTSRCRALLLPNSCNCIWRPLAHVHIRFQSKTHPTRTLF